MIAAQLNRSHERHTLRLPADKSRTKHRRYLIGSVTHSHAGHVVVHVQGAHGSQSLVIANDTPVEVTP